MTSPLSISNIRANLLGGGARPSKFQVIITNPIVTGADAIAPFMIKAANLPADSIGSIPVPYMGRMWPIPGDRSFQPWSTTIINDENFKVRDALETWMGNINSHRGNEALKGSGPQAYLSQASVTQYGKDGSILRIYQFNNIWPSDIQEIDLGWDQVDAIEEFQVTWQYEDWKIVGGVTGDAGGTTGDATDF